MLLGPYMPGPVRGWRFVEGDLHGVAGRVIEYDRDARLVREDGSGQLGLSRWQQSRLFNNGGYWTLARPCHDLDTDAPLVGEPDARVLRFQRSTDSWGRDMRKWHEKSKDAQWRREAREQDAEYEQNLQMAELFMHAAKKDVSARPRAFIGKGLAA